MWNLLNCYLSGRHEYGVWCEPGKMFLRCVHCGKRSQGWAIDSAAHVHPPAKPAVTATRPPGLSRVLPFGRAVAR
jgi:hypothetical protein